MSGETYRPVSVGESPETKYIAPGTVLGGEHDLASETRGEPADEIGIVAVCEDQRYRTLPRCIHLGSDIAVEVGDEDIGHETRIHHPAAGGPGGDERPLWRTIADIVLETGGGTEDRRRSAYQGADAILVVEVEVRRDRLEDTLRGFVGCGIYSEIAAYLQICRFPLGESHFSPPASAWSALLLRRCVWTAMARMNRTMPATISKPNGYLPYPYICVYSMK